jgi:hypothetical protein
MVGCTEFESIEQASGYPFTFEACCNDERTNTRCADGCSPSHSFLEKQDLTNQHVWLNAPFYLLMPMLKHYLSLKARSPTTTSACILIPRWQSSPWHGLLHGMQRLKEFPAGYPLFVDPMTQKSIPGIPWPVDIYYDAPYEHMQVATATAQENNMLMTFHGTINGTKGLLAMDSQASHCFIDAKFVKLHNLVTTPTHRMVELANGSMVQLGAECSVRIVMPTKGKGTKRHYKRAQSCYVVDMSGDHDIILGQNWLLQEKVDLSFSQKEAVLHRTGCLLAPVCKRPKAGLLPVLSAIQMRRHITSSTAAKWFMVNVVDDKLTGHVLEPHSSPQPVDSTQVFSTQVSPPVQQLLAEYKEVFAERTGLPPDRGIAHVIPEEPGAKPVYKNPYRLSPIEVLEVERQIKGLLAMGLIEPSNSPYGAPILFVGKKDGSLRMCCDWRRLNSQTIKSRYPLPRIDQLLDQLHGATIFSSLDLQSGYHQILINPEDVPKTAFTTPFGHYQFKVMSFGLCNAPATFQAVMNKIFKPLLNKGVLVYMDDILIFAKSKAEHVELLRQVLQILKENNFFARLDKCEFEQHELKYLGHIVSADGIKVNPVKTKSISEWPTPKSVKDIRSFLGLANYFRKFVQGFAVLTAPLTALTRKDVGFVWTDQCQKAFDGVKHALTHAPVLAMPDFTRPSTMEVLCDASIIGIGAVLTQDGRPLAYESKRLSDAEVKWTTTDQELWAVVHALKIWRCYLEGVKFTVVTDHNPLVHLQTQPNLSRRQARWAEYLQRFDLQWTYRPGRTNVADPLSRIPLGPTAPLILNAITLAAVVTRHQAKAVPPEPTLVRKRKAPSVEGVATTTPVDAPGHGVPPPAQIDPTGGPIDAPRERVGPMRGGILHQLQEGYALDAWFSDPNNTKDLTHRDGLWWLDRRIAVPNMPGLRRGILYEVHDAPYSGHMGVAKTVQAVYKMYWWPKWRQFVTQYVQTCTSCQRNKATNQLPAGLLHPLPIPSQPWDSVSMDFIAQLPPANNGHDAIIVFVDRLTKMVHLASTSTTVTAEGTAQLFADHVFKLHGVPKDIVTDRGSTFVAQFMTELLRLVGTKHNRTTAYHPQSDGQTERVNRVLEEMLRHYVGGVRHRDWANCLSAAEFAINNAHHESTGTTPFRLNFGRDPHLPLSVSQTTSSGARVASQAASFADRMSTGLADAKRCLQAAQHRQKVYYDLKRRDVSFQVGEEVFLSTKNISLRRTGDKGSTHKLMPKYIGPFPIVHVVGRGAYALKLPEHLKIHPIFHVSLLKPYKKDSDPARVQPPPAPIELENGPEYFVGGIRNHRSRGSGNRKTREFLVQWTGYGPEFDTWEPESAVLDTAAYEQYIQQANLVPQGPLT